MGLQTSCGVAVNIVYPNIRHVPSYIKTESFEGTFKNFHHIVCVFPRPDNTAHNIQVISNTKAFGLLFSVLDSK